MGLQPQPRNCDRARAWVSLRLDGEISELEEKLLEAHLGRCAACSEFEESVRGTVVALRSRPLERLEHPISVTGRRRVRVRPAAVARVAAVVAAVAGATTVLTTQVARSPATHAQSPTSATVAVEDKDLEQLRTLKLLQLGGRPHHAAGAGSFGAAS
jgi:anti-sigma factor RsiW